MGSREASVGCCASFRCLQRNFFPTSQSATSNRVTERGRSFFLPASWNSVSTLHQPVLKFCFDYGDSPDHTYWDRRRRKVGPTVTQYISLIERFIASARGQLRNDRFWSRDKIEHVARHEINGDNMNWQSTEFPFAVMCVRSHSV